jgi:signal transduction histidine kinase
LVHGAAVPSDRGTSSRRGHPNSAQRRPESRTALCRDVAGEAALDVVRQGSTFGGRVGVRLVVTPVVIVATVVVDVTAVIITGAIVVDAYVIDPTAESLARHHGHCLTCVLEVTGHLEVDPERIEQAASILVDNAARHTPPGPCLQLRGRTTEGTLVLEVVDAGRGIPAGEIPLLFERFYRVGGRRERRKGGTGLGLAIAKTIVEAHGRPMAARSASKASPAKERRRPSASRSADRAESGPVTETER